MLHTVRLDARVPDDRQRPHGGDPRADEPDRQLLDRPHQAHPRDPDDPVQRRGSRRPTRRATSARARSRSAPASGRSPASRRPRSRTTTSSSTSSSAGARRRCSPADTLFSPEQFRYSPAGGVPPGDYFVQVCDFGTAPRWADAADVHRHDHDRRQPGSARLLGALEGVPGHPAARADRHVPVGQSEHRHPQDVVLAARLRAATSSSATSPRARRGTTTRGRT